MKTKIAEGGRIVIPSRYRKALGLKPGDDVFILLEDSEIRIINTRQAIAHAQATVRRYVPESRSLSHELIEERRKETASE